MSFDYTRGSLQTAITPPAKDLYCKSFLIDIAAGDGFTSGTSYTIGYLPAGSQVIGGNLVVPVAVAGGTVSAATLTLRHAGQQILTNGAVFSTGSPSIGPVLYFQNRGWATAGDGAITYTPTLTGAGATAGQMYVNVFYVA